MPSPVAEILAALRDALERIGMRWYLFGAQAALLYGAARLTADVDITVELGSRTTAELVRALEESGFALRIEHDVDAFVAQTRVLPFAHVSSAMAVDVVLAGPGLEELFLDHLELHDIEGTKVPVASAEDLVAMKILAGRPKDLGDVAAIIATQKDFDVERARQTLRLVEQALDQSDLVPELDKIVDRHRPRKR